MGEERIIPIFDRRPVSLSGSIIFVRIADLCWFLLLVEWGIVCSVLSKEFNLIFLIFVHLSKYKTISERLGFIIGCHTFFMSARIFSMS